LIRHVLGNRTSLPAHRIGLGRAGSGKPFLLDPALPIAFSIAHSGDLAVCAIADVPTVGIDVEPVDRAGLDLAVLQGLLSPVEQARIEDLPGASLQEALVAAWTGKEAVAKAHGGGLSLPLDRIEVPPVDGPVDMAAIPDAEPPDWSLYRLCPDRRHRIAVALPVRFGTPTRITCRQATELPAWPTPMQG
jgi:4'-phosphopantetheinyl transferase